ncbi:hypothetical protein DTO166G4_684 [Paecilomyces variotii]|uniref:Uncharacterized protein n=1 Tax=Byssochlamys spectabilis TaxID=264951 RepID=A0A443I4K1_BYSSP|nr:hypothetical protein C8Q69DRAFT_440069 [Paecilomyces variotii]KAJ9191751.1 hypothetical protein DTO032I3_8673 [Paecilomyces variotii]KAJ9205009.1 hypothetical protein DTO164E3_1632 [Paecilomyces variotii]KAJ9217502.1 hypothetical protein DTO166G4_684 [Paecilomyces variotii]KAJ9226557.1 hypothetical protein DTO169C6_1285 [Paecilomyces variotii]KAJ9230065.1 hypothetical protein DTO169E5_8586 [Paecilomyces variotii]
MSTPTLINLPPPPSDPVTPSEMGPGTPNSGTTSLSALSTTAIKDGHQGQIHPHSHHAHHSSSASGTSTTTLDAERADRISRLAGLERVAAARAGAVQGSGMNVNTPFPAHLQGYFDNYPHIKERSTVGSASATGSVGGRTTWASGSDAFDPDKMSEDPDDGVSSVGGMSDECNASLVGFGEGASSTISGPVSNAALSRMSSGGRPNSLGSPTAARSSLMASYLHGSASPLSGVVPSSPSVTGSNTPEASADARMVDGMTYDPDVVDTTVRTPQLVSPHSRTTSAAGSDLSGQGPQRPRAAWDSGR